MKIRILILAALFAVACHSAKKPDAVDVARIEKLTQQQQKRMRRWAEIQTEALNLKNEFETAQKEIDAVREDAVRRAGLDPAKFDVDYVRKEFMKKPAPLGTPTKK